LPSALFFWAGIKINFKAGQGVMNALAAVVVHSLFSSFSLNFRCRVKAPSSAFGAFSNGGGELGGEDREMEGEWRGERGIAPDGRLQPSPILQFHPTPPWSWLMRGWAVFRLPPPPPF